MPYNKLVRDIASKMLDINKTTIENNSIRKVTIMEIIKKLENNSLTLSLVGELNTVSAPELEKVIKDELAGVKNLVLDLAKLDYLSSAGLRVVLMAQKVMNKQGGLVVKHVNSQIMDIFDMTGFTAVLTIEN